jgi:hypothetical protein
MRLATGLFIGLVSSATLAADPPAPPAQQVGMIADPYGMVFVFDTDPASVVGAIRVTDPGSGGIGDCVVSPDGRRGYVTDGNHHVWVIDLTSIPPQLAPGTNPIALSGLGLDVASTADGRFLVVCDSGFTNLISVVDVAGRVESSTFNIGARCSAVDVCSDGSVLVAADGASVVRLAIDAAGHLSDTGQRLSSVDAANVYCSPNGGAGVAQSISGHLRSFRVSGMIGVSDRNLSTYGASGVMAKDGTRFYGRSFDGLEAYDFDQATAELAAAPVYSAAVGSLGWFNNGGADQLALDFAGASLYTPERFQLNVNDAVTGEALPPLPMPDLQFSAGICIGPKSPSGCRVAECDDGNPCTDDVCGDSGCLHVPNDSNPCGNADDCTDTHVCRSAACVAAGPADCNALCPPGFAVAFGSCQKTYDIDASLLDHLDDACDASGTDRFHCAAGTYGFHWTDDAGSGVGPVDGIDMWIVTGMDCGAAESPLSLNGAPYLSIGSDVDCTCAPGHTPIRLFPPAEAYVKGGLNTISIATPGTCEGLSKSPILDGLFARVTVAYHPLDPNCSEGVCNPATHRCEYTVQDCDDGDPCTDDACDASGGCVHTLVPEFTPCDDGNICNGNEFCHADGGCYADYPGPCYDDNNPCTDDRCDPVIGCVNTPIDCDDHNPCTDDSCDYYAGCIHVESTAGCDDANACTTGDVCGGGTCHPGAPVICDDANPCTDDSCDPAIGCVYVNNTAACDDGNACTTGDRCAAPAVSLYLAEDFDDAVAPALPDGWSSTVIGNGPAWATDGRSGDSAPNSAFGRNGDHVAQAMLETPPIAIGSPTARLTFRNRWSFDSAGWCFDAGVLEIKIGATEYVDILAAGGAFLRGGYSGSVFPDRGNPLASRPAWCFESPSYPAYLTTDVALPASAAGQTIRLRWRMGTDSSGHAVGQNIDGIVITDTTHGCRGGAALDCDDGNPCTDDSCEPATGCVHVDNTSACDDGNACTIGDHCGGGLCHGGSPVTCAALDQCHAAGVCDPAVGGCSNPSLPDGTACDDHDLCTTGESCQAGVCTPAFSGLNEPNPRTNGYYKRLCQGPHAGDQLTDADAVCVAAVAPTFAGISTVGDLCAELQPSQPNSDPCDRADDDLMVLALNICRARVCTAQSIDSQCGANGNVGQSLAQSDAILASASRGETTCAQAKCLDEEINTGRALELNTLTVRPENDAIRLAWAPPYLDDGTGHPSTYDVWRRPLGADTPFAKIGTTADASFVDLSAANGAFEYEVTAVMR